MEEEHILWLDERSILDESELIHLLIFKDLSAYNDALERGQEMDPLPYSPRQIANARAWYAEKIAPFAKALSDAMFHNSPEPYERMTQQLARRRQGGQLLD